MKNKYSKLPLFLVIAWISAFIFEEYPRFILGDIHLWEMGDGWFLFFLIWYGTLFLIAYLLCINRPIKYAVFFGLLYGIIFETFYFKKMENIISFILFVAIYLGMFYFPFKIIKTIYYQEKVQKSEIVIVIAAQLIALTLLFLVRSAS
ncbi:hypothetical protein ACFLY1_01055 [Patescibacteria group bacterium]